MDPNKFTTKSQQAIQNAQSLAIEKGQQQVDVWHLILALISQEGSLVPEIFKKMQIDLQELRAKVIEEIERIPKVQISGGTGNIFITQKLALVLDSAEKEAKNIGDEFISTEHLLLAILRLRQEEGKKLEDFGIEEGKVLSILKDLRGSQRVDSPEPEGKFQALEKYTINLTQLAKKGRLDPVIGRDNEIRRTMQVLSRRTKNNPVLLGEPGTGKTAIVEGLAQRIVAGDVPDNLKNKQLISLDMGMLLAGAKFRGEFEDRLKAILKEIENSGGNYVTFIDEMHTLVGAGATEGALDASNMLKPALARGTLKMIGATTLKEYQKYIEKDAALERRFQPVYIGEPSKEDAVAILRGIKEKYELHHGVKITDEAIIAAVELSVRYIPERFLPDKAIDLIDEATSSLRMEIESMPADIDQMERTLRKLEIEEKAIKRERNGKVKEKLDQIKKQKSEIKEQLKKIKLQWQMERDMIMNIRQHKQKIDSLKIEAEKMEREGKLDKVAEINYGKIPQLKKQIKEEEDRLNKIQGQEPILKEEVTSQDVAEVVARWTGVPVSKMLQKEAEKFSKMEEEISRRVVGQEEAVTAVSNAIRRSRAGVAEENRPIGSFIFLGPTGVGKTELAKALAEFMFDDENAMIRVDMSEYMESHSIAKFIGSPPGYVGYEEGGQLTEKIRRRPYSVILFDEIEKAHPSIFNAMLQILDDGRLTDAKGRTINFKNTVIILTSNIGSDIINQTRGIGFKNDRKSKLYLDEKEMKVKVLAALRENFRPEFLNRLDEIIIFHPLDKKELQKIVDLQIERLNRRLSNQGIEIELSKNAREYLLKKGYDPAYGARPMKRAIQSIILDELALLILEGKAKKRKLIVDIKDDKAIFL
ncbi:MAG: ATP-dependent chaperone ClpB [Candidatus Moranbacteria bacterium]|nr:ATP-dependent chaperone ClpB [Candidatus Moranbacteria bacterium]